MKLSSSLRALTLAGVCALPLPAGVLTFNFTETGGDVVVTASGSITDSRAWTVMAQNTTVGSYIDPSQGQLGFGNGTSTVANLFFASGTQQSGNWISGFGPGTPTPTPTPTPATSYGGDTLGFVRNFPFATLTFPALALPTGYSFNPSFSQLLSSTLTFTGTDFTTLGITTGSYVFQNGGDTIQLTVGSGGGSGGGSSVPDAGPGPALALLLGGLGLRQWRSSRRARAAA